MRKNGKSRIFFFLRIIYRRSNIMTYLIKGVKCTQYIKIKNLIFLYRLIPLVCCIEIRISIHYCLWYSLKFEWIAPFGLLHGNQNKNSLLSLLFFEIWKDWTFGLLLRNQNQNSLRILFSELLYERKRTEFYPNHVRGPMRLVMMEKN